MVNINITIPDELHKKLKIAAAVEDKSIKDIVIESLEQYVAKMRGSQK